MRFMTQEEKMLRKIWKSHKFFSEEPPKNLCADLVWHLWPDDI